jgi:tripartite-type tricarboxylate transporter receptor subunit TctC
MKELIELTKRQPGKMHYSSPGNGGPQHLAMELVKLETGMDIVHVPYKAAAGALTDVVGGHVDATVAAVQTAHPHVQSGKLRALAVMSAERSPAYPDADDEGAGAVGPRSRPGYGASLRLARLRRSCKSSTAT